MSATPPLRHEEIPDLGASAAELGGVGGSLVAGAGAGYLDHLLDAAGAGGHHDHPVSEEDRKSQGGAKHG